MTDVHKRALSVTTDGKRVQIWAAGVAFPVLELDQDEAISLAIEVERAVEDTEWT